MWLAQLSIVLCSLITSEATFGTPYLKNSRICGPWNCVNTKLGLPLSLPPRVHYAAVLKSLLPEEWNTAIEATLDSCYLSRPRKYVNTCPGQALLHCTVDNLIENCPEERLRKDDGCYAVSSTAGFKHMFSQSRYQDLEKNLSKEKRPAWFVKHSYKGKCCNLPKFINTSVLNECGFTNFLIYYDEKPRTDNITDISKNMKEADITNKPNVSLLHDLKGETDPLDCCDMRGFINPSWRSLCDFRLSWDSQKRLQIKDEDLAVTTTVPPLSATIYKDIRIVPLTCEKETCVFKKLNVLTESGSVDVEAFTKLLDNFTNIHPTWNKAKARVITVCLSKSSLGYDADCDINKVLSCTLDVLSENCPYGSKPDICRHSKQNSTSCQTSSSKYRPKNRRAICSLPNLVKADVLAECGITSVSRMEYVTESRHVNKPSYPKYTCKDSTTSTLCFMNKMGVLNKYGFMDYFKMKDRIREFTDNNLEWRAFKNFYLSIFSELPLYNGYCNSPKKLLNLIDTMLMTCPVSKRKDTPQCNIFFDAAQKIPQPDENRKITEQFLALILSSYNITLPLANRKAISSKRSLPKADVIKKNELYGFGVLGTENAPPVKVINVKQTSQRKPTLVLLPVYMRARKDYLKGGNTLGPYKDGVFTSPSFM